MREEQERCAALKRDGWMEFFGLRNPRCPHCGTEHDISESGAYRLYEEGEHELDCESCEREFTVSTRVSYTFSTDTQEASE